MHIMDDVIVSLTSAIQLVIGESGKAIDCHITKVKMILSV